MLCVFWSIYPLAWAKYAAFKLQTYLLEEKKKNTELLSQPNLIKQSVQTHFRKFNIYIPFEDVKTREPLVKKRILAQHENFCGTGKILVWIPYQIKVPQPLQRRFTLEFCQSYL